MILDYFKARPKHLFVEFDYKQLEIRVLALASGDEQLIKDIEAGVDMHTYFASQIFDSPEAEITPEERRMAKGFSFQLQYGAGANGIARFWDVSKALAEDFIENYYRRYPQIKSWQEEVFKEAQSTLEYTGDMRDGYSVQRGYIPSIWRDSKGAPVTRYRVLTEQTGKETTWRSHSPTLSHTKSKNYPIQGAASDILMMMMNRLTGYTAHTSVTILNTVHDSILVEIPEEETKHILDISEVLEGVPEVLWELFEVDSPVQFPVEWASGKTLAEVKQSN
jgi:DNA polymerase-1